METIEYKGYKIKISQSDFSENPREWEKIGKMCCFHGRYKLPNETEFDNHDYNSWLELEKDIKRMEGDIIILPVYMYDYVGVVFNTTGFSCCFDSGKVGYIYMTKEQARKEQACKRLSKKQTEKITEYLKNEVDNYSLYASGEVYDITVVDKDDEAIYSTTGFLGYDHAKNEVNYIIDSL